jgi:hypothetical protein
MKKKIARSSTCCRIALIIILVAHAKTTPWAVSNTPYHPKTIQERFDFETPEGPTSTNNAKVKKGDG